MAILGKSKKWNNGNVFEAPLLDLSKSFDCLPHDSAIAKLNSYGFNFSALKLIRNYLTKKKQVIKLIIFIVHTYFGVPQLSILGLIVFSIFLSNLPLIVKDIDITIYADNSTIYKKYENIDNLILSLEDTAASLFKQFSDNQMKNSINEQLLQ